MKMELMMTAVKKVFPATRLFESEMWNRYVRHHFDEDSMPLREDVVILVKSNAISYIIGFLSGEGQDENEIVKIHKCLIENYYNR